MQSIIQQKLADAVSFNLPDLVDREYSLPEIPNKAFSIIGMRRSGKTYYLYQIMKKLGASGIERSRLVYINFEDERLSDLTRNELHRIVDEYYAIFPENRSVRVYFFFDEIHLVDEWETFVRRLIDTEKVEIYLSGSSAKMLSREIASSMRGRAVEKVIYPYSFNEYLHARQIEINPPYNRINKQERSLLENKLREYLITGGFPEVINLGPSDHHLLLQGYVQTVLYRDIIDRYNISNTNALKMLIRHLLRNNSCRFSVNKFYNHLKSMGIKVGKNILYEFLEYLIDTFLIQTIHIDTESERKRMVNPVKIYAIDTGIALSYSTAYQPDIGRLLESCVLMELCRRNTEVTYFTTDSGFEVDFKVVYPDKRIQLIQVSADISDKNTMERELRALKESCKYLPEAELILVTITDESMIESETNLIKIIPAWKWLLDR